MPEAADTGARKPESGSSEIAATRREAPASQPEDRPTLGATIIFDTLQYAMFDNVAEAFHFHADLNPDLTHVKQPVIHEWTEGEKQRPVERLSAAEFQRREQKIAHYLRGIGVQSGKARGHHFGRRPPLACVRDRRVGRRRRSGQYLRT